MNEVSTPESVIRIGRNRGYLIDSKKKFVHRVTADYEEAGSPLNRAAPVDLKSPVDQAIVLCCSTFSLPSVGIIVKIRNTNRLCSSKHFQDPKQSNIHHGAFLQANNYREIQFKKKNSLQKSEKSQIS